MKLNSGTWKIIGAIACIALLVATFAARKDLQEAIYPPSAKSRTSSMDVVEIALYNEIKRQTLRLRVPEAYLVKAEQRRGGNQRFVTIETQLPDLKPAPAMPPIVGVPGSPEYEESLRQFKNGIVVNLWADNVDVERATTSIRKRLSNEDRRIGASNKYVELSPGVDGLAGFSEWSCRLAPMKVEGDASSEVCSERYYEHYFASVSDAYFYAICAVWKISEHPRHGCQVSSAFRGHSLRYIVRYTELHRWHEFDSAIRKLLESFVMGES